MPTPPNKAPEGSCFCRSAETCTCPKCPRCGHPANGHTHDPAVLHLERLTKQSAFPHTKGSVYGPCMEPVL